MYPELGTGRFLTEPTCPAQRGMRVRTSRLETRSVAELSRLVHPRRAAHRDHPTALLLRVLVPEGPVVLGVPTFMLLSRSAVQLSPDGSWSFWRTQAYPVQSTRQGKTSVPGSVYRLERSGVVPSSGGNQLGTRPRPACGQSTEGNSYNCRSSYWKADRVQGRHSIVSR